MALPETLIHKVETVHPAKGEVVVVTIDPDASIDHMRAASEHLRRAFPDNHVIVLAGGADLQTLSPEDLSVLGLRRALTTLLAGAPILHRAWAIPAWVTGIDAAADTAGLEVRYVAVGDRARDPESFEALEAFAGSRLLEAADTPEPDRDTQCDCSARRAGIDGRHWCPGRHDHMATVRNRLLAIVRRLGPDLFLSVDTDIILHPDAILRMQGLIEKGAAAAGSRCYLTLPGRLPNQNRSASNYGIAGRHGGGFSRPDTTSEFRCDVLMAIKLMTPPAYGVDYEGDRRGEDFGWSRNARAAGLPLAWSGQVTSKHVMREDLLTTVDPRVGW